MLWSQKHYPEREEDKEERKIKEIKEGMKNVTYSADLQEAINGEVEEGVAHVDRHVDLWSGHRTRKPAPRHIFSLSHNTLRVCVSLEAGARSLALSLSLCLGPILLILRFLILMPANI